MVLPKLNNMLYLIEILHQTTTSHGARRREASLYLIEILHQTTTLVIVIGLRHCCILSKFYIKPQLRLERELARCVVSYRNSTSNHNAVTKRPVSVELYLIEILHQTTTCFDVIVHQRRCILSKFYIKPQLRRRLSGCGSSCILSKFYIKPQLARQWLMVPCGCILSKFYIKPQLGSALYGEVLGCILSKFYIKPQHNPILPARLSVVSYRNSTSNHNANAAGDMAYRLYLIEILHQTTTART